MQFVGTSDLTGEQSTSLLLIHKSVPHNWPDPGDFTSLCITPEILNTEDVLWKTYKRV